MINSNRLCIILTWTWFYNKLVLKINKIEISNFIILLGPWTKATTKRIEIQFKYHRNNIIYFIILYANFWCLVTELFCYLNFFWNFGSFLNLLKFFLFFYKQAQDYYSINICLVFII